MGKRSWIFLTGTCTEATIRFRETSSLRSDVCSSLLEVWEWGAWQTPWSGQTPNCVRWRFFHLSCVPSLVSTPNKCVKQHHPPTFISLLRHALGAQGGGGSYNIHSADDKKGYTPQKNIDKKGEHEVLSTARFSTYMWSLASLQRPRRMYALPRYTIIHIFTITVSEQPNAQRLWYKRTSTLLSEKANVMVLRTYR